MSKPFAIVTGASSGIGLELAAICAQEGFDLLVAADRPEIQSAAECRRCSGRYDGIPSIAGSAFQRSLRKRQALIAYLRDHLSGADMPLRVVHRVGSTHTSTDATLFRRLSKEFEEDRAVVRVLLDRLGASGRSIKRAAGYASGAVLSVTAGGEPGDLSLLRTLEGLAIGVQGKRCLWRALQNLRTAPSGMNFTALEAKAVRQWEAIEERRRAVVTRTFSATDSRAQ